MDKDELLAQVRHYAAQGESTPIIAGKLGISIAEVERLLDRLRMSKREECKLKQMTMERNMRKSTPMNKAEIEKRNQAILAMRDDGVPVNHIAREMDLTPAMVYKVIRDAGKEQVQTTPEPADEAVQEENLASVFIAKAYEDELNEVIAAAVMEEGRRWLSRCGYTVLEMVKGTPGEYDGMIESLRSQIARMQFIVDYAVNHHMVKSKDAFIDSLRQDLDVYE